MPAEFAAYTRRWQIAQPGKAPFVDLMAATGIGPEVDFEHEVYNVSRSLPQAAALHTMDAVHIRRIISLPHASHMYKQQRGSIKHN